ncbi:MAG: S-layer family protein [Nostoc sp. NOS(2021)]|uniref:S-layer family protein n=1 Tax=Nostoc sp. NOS(2021) TaxID=2815407 RepID=UPI0025D745A2|nr:S-layer family protein [Nostoc sp. NOS(2021)]MBN3898001.1 S-layer family protein [Nostoc sp. NOS(2021)]
MKIPSVCWGLINVMLTGGMLLWCRSVSAQVTPDGTLNTTVSQSGNNFTITNGSAANSNLFHSFRQFSVPTGGSATFNLINTPNISTIFSRVTGGNISNIDGLIQTINSNNPISLLLINPSGIIFGANAKLNIGGSFIGTTANSIKFADGIEFSAINSQSAPLLSINVPIGLQMGSNPASINVQGTGHALTLGLANNLASITRTPSPTELRVQPGKTLALVGGNLNLNGATLTAEQGQIELGSVSGIGLVNLIPDAQGYTLGYANGQSFSDVKLTGRSLLDVSGMNAGSVEIQGKEIQFTDSSLALAQNLGNLPGGNLHLQASAGIDLTGTTSGVRSETLGIGTGGNISVITPRFSLQQGAALSSITYGVSASGNIQIDASALEISGFSLTNSNASVINTSTFGSGNAGNIFVNGDSLLISNGGALFSASLGVGDSGEVIIHNIDTIIRGSSSRPSPTVISSTAFSRGNAKSITLDTARLQLLDGGTITTGSFFVGHGGDISVNATESIQISGGTKLRNSAIDSSTMHINPTFQKLLRLPNILTADAGTISITTPSLTLRDGGTVSVTSQGSGNGGSINITANTIRLDRQGSIQAQTESGNGGNINLQVGKLLLLRHHSAIAATAGGNGDGGNININAPIIAGLENSDIIANAIKGRGGNIQITTQGIFGLKLRNQLTPDSDITASSQFGLSGTVQVNTIGVDPNSGLVELPANVTDPSQQIATGCSNTNGSSFVATGRGGVPQNPLQQVTSDRTWDDVRDLSAYRKTGELNAQIPASPEVLVEATSWHRNADGKVELIAAKPAHVQPSLTCAAIPRVNLPRI